jgi:hypothetical protein
MSNPIFDQMLKAYYAVPDQGFNDRPKLERMLIHPMVHGYVDAVLAEQPFKTIEDITERTYAQLIRDCGAFYIIRKKEIEELAWFNPTQVLYELGQRFWLSRQLHFDGFDFQSHPHAEVLHNTAWRGFCPVWIVEDEQGQLDYTWEEPNDDTDEYTFDFS